MLEEATDRAKQKAIDAGAAPEGCQVCTQPYHMCMTCRGTPPELTCGIPLSIYTPALEMQRTPSRGCQDCYVVCVQIHSIVEVPLAYLPGGLTRVLVRVIGSLKGFSDLKLLNAQHQSSAHKQAGQDRCPFTAKTM